MPERQPPDYDPELTERLLEKGGKLLGESRRLIDDLNSRLDDDDIEPPRRSTS